MKIVRLYRYEDSPMDIACLFDVEIGGFRINGFAAKRKENKYVIEYPCAVRNEKRTRIAYPTSRDSEKELIKTAQEAIKLYLAEAYKNAHNFNLSS